ncbi:Bug family tripartite tricarboxylate transporter substrate binding protein [Natrarchaeobius oligotrophus]|nr:tripartite tricarboxylate transporter substrate binding protein [Natrarchaeobius chitinivorans]
MHSEGQSVAVTRRGAMKIGAAGVSTIGISGCLVDDASGEYPSGTLEMIVPYDQGGATDAYSRIMANTLPEILGESIEVNNQPGASSLLGVGQVAQSDNDGYTLGSMNIPGTPVAYLGDSQEWELTDLEYISTIGGWQFVILSNPDEDIDGIDDLTERYESGEFTNIGGVSTGGEIHALALFLQEEGIVPWAEYIPYSSGGEAIQNVVSGEVPVALAGDVPSLETVEDGQADIICTFMEGGSPVYPDVPSLIDEGYTEEEGVLDLLGGNTTALFAPPGTSSEAVDTIMDAMEEAAESDEVSEWEQETQFNVDLRGPAETAEMVDDSLTEIPEVIDMDLLEE